VAPGARVIGDVTLAPHASVWFGTVVRGEAAPVDIEEGVNIQDNSIVESTPGHPVRIGARAALGHNARVYGATLESRCLIAIGATVLQGAHVGTHSIIAANAVVPEGMQVPPNSVVVGNGRLVREVTEQEVMRIHFTADAYARLAASYGGYQLPADEPEPVDWHTG
jgi:carbonic anhydrase/acetyltransferase-like protein (isoleucine patch superfamily)